MKKKVLVIFMLSFLSIYMLCSNTYAYDSITIRFSNVGNSKYTLPPLENYTTVYGLLVSGAPMVKISDFANILGANLSFLGDSWFLDRNLQSTLFVKNSTTMWTSNVYSYYDPVNYVYDEYTQTWSGTLPVAAQEINGIKYIPLICAAKQMGALLAEQYSSTEYRIFDFRINYSTPLTDPNEYIVGGEWLTNWSSYYNTNLSDHFDLDEMWSNSSTTYGQYARQLKISVASIESAERVRHYYNSDSSMSLSCAFRCWKYNNSLEGSGVNSFHMRGRAWDCPTDALYTAVQAAEFTVDGGNAYWRANNPTTSYSRGYEIERMESRDNKWLHMQRQPGYDTNPDSP